MARTAPPPPGAGLVMWKASLVAPEPTTSARIVAPRARARVRDSSTRVPAPSPHTKPSRPTSHGRLARSGSSFRRLRANMAENPEMPMPAMVASAPPAIMTSARPYWIQRMASPSACALDEQALVWAKLGPRKSKAIEICPAAMLAMSEGIRYGPMRPGPLCSSVRVQFSSCSSPPMPTPMKTPTRSRSSSVRPRFACSKAIRVEAIAKGMKRERSLTFFFSIQAAGSKFLTSQAIRVGKRSSVGNSVIGPAPLCPRQSAPQDGSVPTPSGVTIPIPVMTTRSIVGRASGVLVDVVDGVLDRADLLGLFVRDVDLERFFEGQNQLDQAERVRAEIVDERRLGFDVGLLHVQLFLDDLLNLGEYVAICHF